MNVRFRIIEVAQKIEQSLSSVVEGACLERCALGKARARIPANFRGATMAGDGAKQSEVLRYAQDDG